MKVSISTGAFPAMSPKEAFVHLTELGVDCIEFSGGFWEEGIAEWLRLASQIRSLRFHNYFPPPKTPFVFNLASDDSEISRLSVSHAENTIRLVKECGGSEYSFHAGFLIDPQPSEIGKPIQKRKLMDRDKAIQRFIARIRYLADIAGENGIQLLIENNVLSRRNFSTFESNPLLMVEPAENRAIMMDTPDNVSLMLDVAHLKVSANTLKFEAGSFFELCDPWIAAYHLSDNDGISDTNAKICENSWFWGHLNSSIAYVSLEVYGVSDTELLDQVRLVKSMVGNAV